MGQAFKAFFAFIQQLFSAAEKGASAVNHLATWADEAAGTFADKARHDRNEENKELMRIAGITEFPSAPVKSKSKPLAVAAQ